MSGQYGDYAANQGASYHGYGAPGDMMQQNYGAQANDMHGMQQGASYDQYGQGRAGFQGHGGQYGEGGLDARAAQEAREMQKLQQLQQLGLTGAQAFGSQLGAAGTGGQHPRDAQQMSSEALLQNYPHLQGGQQGYLGMQQSIQQQPNSAAAYQDRGVMQQEPAGYMGMDPLAYQAPLQAGSQGPWPSGGPQGAPHPPQAGAGGVPGSSVVFDPTTGMGFLPGGNSAEAPAHGRYGGYDEPGANRMGRGRDQGPMGMDNAGTFGRMDGPGMPHPQGGGGMGMGMGIGRGPGGGGMPQGRMGEMGMHGARGPHDAALAGNQHYGGSGGPPPRDMGMRGGPGGPMGMHPDAGERMHRPGPGMFGGGGMGGRGGGMGPGMGAGAMQAGNNMGGPRGFDRGMDRGFGRRSPARGRRSRSPPRRRTPPPKRQRSPSPRRQRSPSPKRRRSPRRDARSERSVEEDKKRDREREEERAARREKEKEIPRALGSNIVRVPLLPLTVPVRDYVDLARRYPRMHIPDDFSRAVTWAGLALLGPDVRQAPIGRDALSSLLSRIPGSRGEQAGAVTFEHVEMEPGMEDSASKEACSPALSEGPPPWGPGTKDPTGTRWRAKVVLPCGVDAEAAVAFKSHGKPQHLHHLLRFVSARKDREGISCLGGAWDATADGCGETPGAPDEAALQRAAIRNVKFETGLDLSVCATWTRFLEVHYKRVDAEGDPYDEIVVVFVPSVADCLPSLEEWPEMWKASQMRINAAKEAKAAAAIDPKHSEEEEAKNIYKGTPSSGAGVRSAGEAMQVEDCGTQLTNAPHEAPKSESQDKPKDGIKEGVQPTIKQGEGSSMADAEVEKKDAKESVSKLEEAPSTPRVILHARNTKDHRLRTMSISLDGLLDYNEQDKDDSTFELSLFSETLHELLMTASVSTFQEFLLEMRNKKVEENRMEADERSKSNTALQKSVEKSELEKAEQTADKATPPDDGTGGKGAQSAKDEDDKKMNEAEDAPKDAKDAPEEKSAAGEEAKPILPNYPVLAAFQYMDKNFTGYIRMDDARQLLHMAGQFTPNRLVREMVSAAADKRSRNRGDRICYRPLVNMPDYD